MNLAEYRWFQRQFLELCGDTRELAGNLQFNPVREKLDGLVHRVVEERFYVTVLGEIKRGKSTFINALLGREILPSASLVCTATLCIISYGDEPRATLCFRHGDRREIPVDSLKQWVTRKNQEVRELERVEIVFPLPILRHGIVLVDTPGVNDTDELRRRVTEEFIPRSDGVILVLNAGQPLSQSEMTFLSQEVLKHHLRKLWFVVNGIDRLENDQQRKEAVDYCRENLATLLPASKVFPLSAKMALVGRQHDNEDQVTSSGLPHFLGEFERELLESRRAALFDVPIGLLHSILADIGRGLIYLQDLLSSDFQKLEETRQALIDKQSAIEAQLTRVLDRFSRAIEARIFELAGEWRRRDLADLRESIRRILRSDDPNERKTFELSSLANQHMQALSEEFFALIHREVLILAKKAGQDIREIVDAIDPRFGLGNLEDSFHRPEFLFADVRPGVGIEGRSFVSSFGRLSTLVFLLQGNLVLAGLSLFAALAAGLSEGDTPRVAEAMKEQLGKTREELIGKILGEVRGIAGAYRDRLAGQFQGVTTEAQALFARGNQDMFESQEGFTQKQSEWERSAAGLNELRQRLERLSWQNS
jgi:GTPase SAR1 family protein